MATTLKMLNGDVDINSSSGRPNVITGEPKTRQDIQEFFSINVLENGFGSGIEQLIGSTGSNDTTMVSLVSRQIRLGIGSMIQIQQSDSRISRPPEERVSGIGSVAVAIDPEDPTRIFFRVNILTDGGAPLSISTSVQR